VAGAAARGRRGFIVVRAGLRFRRPGGPVRGPAGPLPERLRQRRRAGDVRGTGPGAALDGPLPDPCPGALPVSPLRHGGPALRRRGSRLAARKDYLPGRSGPPAGPRLGGVPAASLGVVVPPRRLAPRSRLGAVVFHQAFRGGPLYQKMGLLPEQIADLETIGLASFVQSPEVKLFVSLAFFGALVYLLWVRKSFASRSQGQDV